MHSTQHVRKPNTPVIGWSSREHSVASSASVLTREFPPV